MTLAQIRDADMKRRDFMKSAVVAAGATATLNPARILGANERVQFALIGCGGRGSFVARGLIEHGGECVALCDLRDDRLDEAAEFLSAVQNKKPKFNKEMRLAFEDKNVDAVVVATPDHWHGPASILAVQAGKDVYVEKPHAHNIWESLKMIEAAKKYDRLIQVGTQNRSAPYNLDGLDFVKTGALGKVGLVKVYNLKPGGEFVLGPSKKQMANFDWDAWLGPAPERPYHDHILNGGWHKFWDFSGGDLADDGIHQLDIALMMMGDPGIPKKATCVGGRKVFKDDRQAPDVQAATFDYDDFILTLELTNYPRYMQKTTGTIRRNDELPYWSQNATRVELYGSEQMMTIGRHGGGWQVTTSGGKVTKQQFGRPADEPHYANFLECAKSRKKPNADISVAHGACTMIHMANIAHRVGNVGVSFDADKNEFVDNPDANALVKREYRSKYAVPKNI
jgi:predicted dehydrogenase